jgi:hypothetical protein
VTDPQRLVDELTARGWTVAGHRTGVYVRLRWPGLDELAGRYLFVPLDQAAPDFAEGWQAAIAELEDAVATRQVPPRCPQASTDTARR